jgi:carboxymethylenebutenolidase
MKKILIALSFIASCFYAFAQSGSCCMKPDGMTQFAQNESFKAAHLSPLPYKHKSQSGKMINFKTPDGKTGNAYYVASKQKTNKVLLVFHEWWGLNDYIKKEAEEWQKALGDIDVYALDLYDGKLATTPDEAGKLMQGLDKSRGESIVKGLLEQLGKNKEIATLGWCMGGSWSFNATILAGADSKACIMYYGFPETNEEILSNLKTDVLFIQATQDGFITNELVDNFVNSLSKLGKSIAREKYEADHAFANPSNPKHNKEFSSDAFQKSVRFVKDRLKL